MVPSSLLLSGTGYILRLSGVSCWTIICVHRRVVDWRRLRSPWIMIVTSTRNWRRLAIALWSTSVAVRRYLSLSILMSILVI